MAQYRACSGARTADLFRSFKGTTQVMSSKPDSTVQLVTVTIGGNDVRFAHIIRDCFIPHPECLRLSQMWDYQNDVDHMRASLNKSVYPKLRAAYPKAIIVQVGYPEIAPDAGNSTVRCGWMSKGEQSRIGIAARYLNNSLKIAAGESRQHVKFVSTLDALDGHELCTANSWVVPIKGPIFPYGFEQGHPTPLGQSAIAKYVKGKLLALLPT